MERSLLRKIDDKEIVELTRSLVKIPSVNPPGDEKEIAALIEIVEQSQDAVEGRAAFSEKRKPRFGGR